MDSTIGSTSSLLSWSDTLLTGYAPMDQEHREFVWIVHALQTCPDEQFAACLDDFHGHAHSHFAAEDRWMADSGYPKGDCHVAEHRAVMQSVDEVRGLFAKNVPGAIEVGRRLADELANWFPAHAHHLDSALAHWVSQRNTGGKPVVLRRNVSSSARVTEQQ
jgi:hemerythrin-like metal-binding protein